MPTFVYGGRLFMGRRAPQEKYQTLWTLVELLDNLIGKLLPPTSGVTVGLASSDRQDRIEQQDTLLCPVIQITVRRWRNADISLGFSKDVDERGWRSDALLDGKC